MSQQPQDPDELEAPPLLAQLAGQLVGIGLFAGMLGIGIIIPGKFSPIFVIPMFVALMIGYYVTLAGLSHRYTGSWYTYPRRVKNIPDSWD